MTKWIPLLLLTLVAYQAQAQFETGTRMISGSGHIEHQKEQLYFSSWKSAGCIFTSFSVSLEKFTQGIDASNKAGRSTGTFIGISNSNYWQHGFFTNFPDKPYTAKWGYHDFSVGRFMKKYYRISNKFAYNFALSGGISAQLNYANRDFSNISSNNDTKYDIALIGAFNIGIVYRVSERFVLGANSSILDAKVGFNKIKGRPFAYDNTSISGRSGLLGGYLPTITASYVFKKKG